MPGRAAGRDRLAPPRLTQKALRLEDGRLGIIGPHESQGNRQERVRIHRQLNSPLLLWRQNRQSLPSPALAERTTQRPDVKTNGDASSRGYSTTTLPIMPASS
jgi:hypothetical protein